VIKIVSKTIVRKFMVYIRALVKQYPDTYIGRHMQTVLLLLRMRQVVGCVKCHSLLVGRTGICNIYKNSIQQCNHVRLSFFYS